MVGPKVNAGEVAATLPHGRANVQVVGGLELLNENSSDGTLIANAIITVSIDNGNRDGIGHLARWHYAGR